MAIIVKYCGGLGNTMYQYAIQTVMQNRYPNQTVKADISHYNLYDEHNGFELEKYFGIKFDYASEDEVRKVYCGLVPGSKWGRLPRFVRDFIAHKLQWKYLAFREKCFPEKATKSITEKNIADVNAEEGDWYVRGMWQDTKLFSSYQENIIDAFHVKPQLDAADSEVFRELQIGNAVAVHVRGGDFLNGNTWNLCGEDYYDKAIHYFERKLPLYIFTDDEEYAKIIFKKFVVKGYISHGIDESIKDMYLMSQARYLIISNSTFSFWSAFLNRDAEKIICPKYAIFAGGKYKEANCEKNWISIENRLVEHKNIDTSLTSGR